MLSMSEIIAVGDNEMQHLFGMVDLKVRKLPFEIIKEMKTNVHCVPDVPSKLQLDIWDTL